MLVNLGDEKTAIPQLLDALLLKGSLISIDAMGTHANIARKIREQQADYLLAVKDNQKHLAIQRCHLYTALDILPKAEQWPDLACFAVIESERHEGDKVTQEKRYYISSRLMSAESMLANIRGHWGIENRLHWQLDMSFDDDQMRLRLENAGRNMHAMKQMSLNLLRMDPNERKGSIKTRRLLAAGDDDYRALLMGL